MKKTQTWVDKCYKDTSGKVVITQFPNAPLITWACATALTHVISDARFDTLLHVIAFGAIFTWAWLETFQGVTYFRRVLGLMVFGIIVFNRM